MKKEEEGKEQRRRRGYSDAATSQGMRQPSEGGQVTEQILS